MRSNRSPSVRPLQFAPNSNPVSGGRGLRTEQRAAVARRAVLSVERLATLRLFRRVDAIPDGTRFLAAEHRGAGDRGPYGKSG